MACAGETAQAEAVVSASILRQNMSDLRGIAGLLFLVVASPIYGRALPSPPQHSSHTLTPQEQRVLEGWLAAHTEYRLAADQDCQCADDIERMKAGSGGAWEPVP